MEERPSENGIAARLGDPGLSHGLEGLAAHWFHQIIVVRIVRPAALVEPLTLLNRVRGAWGGRLKQSASAAALGGRPCSFDPPSALDVYFREQLRLNGRHGVPKPYVPALSVYRNHIEVRLTLFGFACDWLAAAREALIAALIHDVDFAPGVTGTTVEGAHLLTAPFVALPPAPDAVVLDFETPFDLSGTAFRDEPFTLIARLARRIDGLARWMDVELDVKWQDLADHWRRLDYGLANYAPRTARRGSRRQNRAFRNQVADGSVLVAGDLAPIWPLLVLGQTCHLGRGATAGQGRYVLEAVEKAGNSGPA